MDLSLCKVFENNIFLARLRDPVPVNGPQVNAAADPDAAQTGRAGRAPGRRRVGAAKVSSPVSGRRSAPRVYSDAGSDCSDDSLSVQLDSDESESDSDESDFDYFDEQYQQNWPD